MSHKYQVIVNEDLHYALSTQEIQNLDITKINTTKYHLVENYQSIKAEIISSNFLERKYTISINGNTYETHIETPLDILIDQMGLSVNEGQMVNEVNAPMPGLILEISVNEGDEIKEGDFLLVLEAMKMENTITSPRDGVIKSISVAKGETVDKNQVLIVFE
ncbi:acetyl-CoA carboxylase biotin carboxyl carrier protein subunit [Mesonia sp. K7]|uniref:acetyl-CoA carboxylase biotin carboxyl carrier protein subunit n=1 Tax=Mesonia sp. K7 TaxID=2218606 RepID=UPI000DAA9FFC|nr:acetyl-CoA carboxylase biotin carboxyl carrier protein subunit [Mesonia sp. K7]PZD77010.1 acetyl-CoA carboxylase biotin carboxyl carrier protein subunit [Mesonia sp. K7]